MSTLKTCPRCGAGLSAPEELQGLCAGCVLVAALDSKPGDGPAETPRRPAPSIEELAPHFPDLELLELVGQGGMGAVYRVRQTKLGRMAALKILALDAVATPAFGERFEREARTLASLDHESIVAVYDSGRAGPWWYLLMEFVDGVSLRQMIRAHEVDPRTALALVAQVCDALQCAHDHGVVHRDIKPENVLVDRKGRAKILDFGLAKLLGREPRTGTLTETGQVMGTPRYMAPEQWERPLTVDHRADIYSVGVVFYELLTGELPIGAFALPSQKGAPDARVDSVVMKTLAKEPERRYQHASEVRTDVQRIESTPPPLLSVPAAPKQQRTGLWIALGAAGCLLLLFVPASIFLFLGARVGALQQDEAMAVAAAAAERSRLAIETRQAADTATARAEGRLSRSELAAEAGPAPRIDRQRARSLHWTELQMDLGDALADLAWYLNLSRAIPARVQEQVPEGAVRFTLPAQPELLRAHHLLLEAVSRSSASGFEYGERAGVRSVTGYSFSGAGYSVAVDATEVLTWSVDAFEVEHGDAGRQPGAGSPAPFELDWFMNFVGLRDPPEFGAEEWVVTLYPGSAPHGSIERAGVRTELDSEALRSRYRYLLHLASSLDSKQEPR